MLIAGSGNDELFGRSGKDVLKGKNGNDHLDGGSGHDKLVGGAGDDLLAGGKGKDLLRGGGGQDAFLFDTKLGHGQVDRIADFHVGVDTIILDGSVFTGIGGPGELAASSFQIGAKAADADDRVIYNSQTGALSYDSDGQGGVAQITFAKLDKGLDLSSHDFLIV